MSRRKKADPLFPHGRCQCDGATCCGGRGPAAFSVVREGKRMIVCTRCDLSSDQDKRVLLTKKSPAKVFFDFDALGAMCLAGYIDGGLKP